MGNHINQEVGNEANAESNGGISYKRSNGGTDCSMSGQCHRDWGEYNTIWQKRGGVI